VSIPELTMREVSARTGVEASTLRVWEQRHGFPSPHRLPSGHRRYSARDVDLIRQVVRDRESGLELKAAIENAKLASSVTPPGTGGDSIFAGLRRRRPELTPYLLPKRTLFGVSHAIEDECGARAEKAMLFASFQRERFYRDAEARWRDLAAPARFAVVLADFSEVRDSAGAPAEVPITLSDPIAREWSLICDAPSLTACLSGWERPGQADVEDMDRDFEMFWSVDPVLVREASVLACTIIERSAPAVAERVRAALEGPVHAHGAHPDTLTSLTNRMVAYVSGGRRAKALPEPHSSSSG